MLNRGHPEGIPKNAQRIAAAKKRMNTKNPVHFHPDFCPYNESIPQNMIKRTQNHKPFEAKLNPKTDIDRSVEMIKTLLDKYALLPSANGAMINAN
jgi:hypothetical protein